MIRPGLLRLAVPAAVFVAAFAAHAAWISLFPERDPVQDQWADVGPPAGSWSERYVESGSYWMGYSYAIALTLGAVALQRFYRCRTRAARRVGVGALSFTGVLAVLGCFLIGCCGSPMLAVWVSLFGAGFAPLAKPLVAALTTLSVGAGWAWMVRRERSASNPCQDSAGPREDSTEPCHPTGTHRA